MYVKVYFRVHANGSSSDMDWPKLQSRSIIVICTYDLWPDIILYVIADMARYVIWSLLIDSFSQLVAETEQSDTNWLNVCSSFQFEAYETMASFAFSNWTQMVKPVKFHPSAWPRLRLRQEYLYISHHIKTINDLLTKQSSAQNKMWVVNNYDWCLYMILIPSKFSCLFSPFQQGYRLKIVSVAFVISPFP